MATRLVDISVLGDKELQRALNKLEKNTNRRIVRAALKKQAQSVAVGAAMKTPVDTGRLRESIAVAAATGLGRGQFGVTVRTGTRKELKIDTKDDYYYPAAVEFGQNVHGSARNPSAARRRARNRKIDRINAGKAISLRSVKGKAFLRSTFDARKADALAAIHQDIARRVAAAWKG